MDSDEQTARNARHEAAQGYDHVGKHWRDDRVYTADVGEVLLSTRQSEIEREGSFGGQRAESFPRAAPDRVLVRRFHRTGSI
jgi:hypothetical protein